MNSVVSHTGMVSLSSNTYTDSRDPGMSATTRRKESMPYFKWMFSALRPFCSCVSHFAVLKHDWRGAIIYWRR